MSAQAWGKWLDRLEGARTQEADISRKLTLGQNAALGTMVFALQQSVARLRREFQQLKSSPSNTVTPQELTRRENLLNQLAQDQATSMQRYNRGNDANGSQAEMNHPRNLLNMQNQIMKDQDQQLEIIGQGVSNLKNYSIAVKDETDLHVALLHDIDDGVNKARTGLESEGARAAHVARSSNNFHLYMIILVLFVILIFLLLAGG